MNWLMEKSKKEKRSDKMMRPDRSVRDFNFPAHNITVQAGNLKEANIKLKEILKPKSENND